jgi:hypothetical protein
LAIPAPRQTVCKACNDIRELTFNVAEFRDEFGTFPSLVAKSMKQFRHCPAVLMSAVIALAALGEKMSMYRDVTDC